jgi:tetratricopeptide (TPR) repeat protein
MLTTLALAALTILPPGDDAKSHDALTRPRMEKMLIEEDHAWIIQTFRRYPSRVLPFIDSYLEGGLKIIEDKGDEETALNMFRMALTFAEIADDAISEKTDALVFSSYAAAFGSWSPAERKRFRDGQAEVGAGRKALEAEPAKALEHFEKALQLAQPLGDTWGMAMAHAGIADAKQAMDKSLDAALNARAAAELYSRLHLKSSEAKVQLALSRIYQSPSMAPETPRVQHLAISALARAWFLVRDTPDAADRAEIRAAYIATLRATGDSERAAEIEKTP